MIVAARPLVIDLHYRTSPGRLPIRAAPWVSHGPREARAQASMP